MAVAPYTLLLFLAAVYGAAWTLAEARVSWPLRKALAEAKGPWPIFLNLIECVSCFGFHLAWIAGWVVFGHFALAFVLAFVYLPFSLVIHALHE